jgi:hypothetical protein
MIASSSGVRTVKRGTPHLGRKTWDGGSGLKVGRLGAREFEPGLVGLKAPQAHRSKWKTGMRMRTRSLRMATHLAPFGPGASRPAAREPVAHA